jgi:tetratricopeptide (TPR) repeat protein
VACFTYLAEDGRASAIAALQDRILAALSPLRQEQENGSSLRASDLRATDQGMILLLRAQAEMHFGRFAEAVRSLEKCIESPIGKQAPWAPKGMAICLLHLGRPDDAIDWYRRALEPNGWEPELVFNFLLTVATFRGPTGVSKELPGLAAPRTGVSVRRNATLSCFKAWRAMRTDDAKTAREAAFDARPYVLLARRGGLPIPDGLPSVDEIATWCAILESVFQWLEGDEQAKAFSEQLGNLPASTVENVRRVFGHQYLRLKGDGGPPNRQGAR